MYTDLILYTNTHVCAVSDKYNISVRVNELAATAAVKAQVEMIDNSYTFVLTVLYNLLMSCLRLFRDGASGFFFQQIIHFNINYSTKTPINKTLSLEIRLVYVWKCFYKKIHTYAWFDRETFFVNITYLSKSMNLLLQQVSELKMRWLTVILQTFVR